MTKEVNILIGRFQPLTKGHLKCIDYAWNKFHIPTVIYMIEPKKLDERHPFPNDVTIPLYRNLLEGNKKILDIRTIDRANLPRIIYDLKKENIVVKSWTCGSDRLVPYEYQVNKYKDSLIPDFELIDIKRNDDDISATKVRQALKDNNQKEFYKLFIPVSLKDQLKYNPYDLLRSFIETY